MKQIRIIVPNILEFDCESKKFAEDFHRGFNDFIRQDERALIDENKLRSHNAYDRGYSLAYKIDNSFQRLKPENYAYFIDEDGKKTLTKKMGPAK